MLVPQRDIVQRAAGQCAVQPGEPDQGGFVAIGIKDIETREKRLGAVDLYFEADSAGGLLHVGIDPPGGGTFRGPDITAQHPHGAARVS